MENLLKNLLGKSTKNKKYIAFFECKWKDLSYRQSLKILEALREKAGFVEWFNEERTEQFGIIVRNLEDKDNLRKKGFLVYDLEDWKYLLLSSK